MQGQAPSAVSEINVFSQKQSRSARNIERERNLHSKCTMKVKTALTGQKLFMSKLRVKLMSFISSKRVKEYKHVTYITDYAIRCLKLELVTLEGKKPSILKKHLALST